MEVMDLKKIAILTNFSGYYRAYSLNIVAEKQVKMLLDNGYKPKVIVMEGFKPEGAYALEGVEMCYTPRIKCFNEWKKDEDFDKDVIGIKASLEQHLKDVDVVISHDLFFQAAMWKYDVVAREIAKNNPKMRWLHWVHSATSADNKKEKFPNSFVVYPNAYDIPRVARAFGYEEDEVKVVPHPIDIPDFFGFHPLSTKIVEEKGILHSDVICTYPLRLDRGKQPEMCIRAMAELKKMDKSVRMVFIDFHSTGKEKNEFRQELKDLAIDKGLNDSEVIFTSEQDETLKLESPRQMVKDFMCISNVFILPSRSETFSLVAQEAGITGNFMILNFDFPPMRSIYGDSPVYRKFSSNINITDGMDGETNTKFGDTDAYFRDMAGYICYMLQNNSILSMKTKIRKEFNMKSVFKKFLEPLMYYATK